MTDDMGCNLEFPDVGELTFPQWRNWLAEYNKFIGERDVRYAAGLRARDDRIEKLEAALREIEILEVDPRCSGQMWVETLKEVARKALEGKDD